MKSDKLFSVTNSLFIGILLILVGMIMIIGNRSFYSNVIHIFVIAILILALKQFISYFIDKKKHEDITFARCFFNLLFCFILSCFKNIPLSFLPIIFGAYFWLNAMIKFISYGILLKNKENGKLTEFFLGSIYFLIGTPFLFAPLKNLNHVLCIMGCYFLLLGMNYILDGVHDMIPRKIKNRMKRKLRITLPAIIEAIIPYTVLNEINYQLDKENYDKPFVFEQKVEGLIPDMEVFVHTSSSGFNRMGHVDLYYQDKVISYGNYDDESMNLFRMIGDGVIFTTDRDKYIPFCIEHSKKTIFAFGLELTDTQKKNINQELKKIFENVYEWSSPYQIAKKEGKNASKHKYQDYASRLYMSTGASFYKVRSGRFKKYFVMGTNCCRLADHIIGKSGIDLLKMNGVITPGTYYEYLNREFQKKNSMVISRKIYNQKNVDKKKIQEIFKGFSK